MQNMLLRQGLLIQMAEILYIHAFLLDLYISRCCFLSFLRFVCISVPVLYHLCCMGSQH